MDKFDLLLIVILIIIFGGVSGLAFIRLLKNEQNFQMCIPKCAPYSPAKVINFEYDRCICDTLKTIGK